MDLPGTPFNPSEIQCPTLLQASALLNFPHLWHSTHHSFLQFSVASSPMPFKPFEQSLQSLPASTSLSNTKLEWGIRHSSPCKWDEKQATWGSESVFGYIPADSGPSLFPVPNTVPDTEQVLTAHSWMNEQMNRQMNQQTKSRSRPAQNLTFDVRLNFTFLSSGLSHCM